ncbi:MAG: hypothetical protein WC593_06255 [Methanoregula sp.]
MGDPYLSSDESLILSTHNIRIDGVSLDLMLTSRRLILIDNSVIPFQLRTIPLEMIITVVSGMDVNGDPIITLSRMDPSGIGAPHPMDFIFTRQNGEKRVTECNEWAATLNNHAAEARNDASSAGTLPYDPLKVIQPRMSATYRIETFSPRKSVTEAYPVKAEPVTSPVLPESLADDGTPPAIDEPPLGVNAEMVKPSGEPPLPPRDTDKMETPGDKETVNSPQEIAIETDETLVISDTKEPVTPPQEITIEADETPEIPATEEPVPPLPEKALGTNETPVISDNEEPVTPPQAIAIGTDEIPIIPDKEESISYPPIPAIAPDETPVISDAARIWADAARTVTITPIPLSIAISEATPARETIDDEPKADTDPIRVVPEEPVAEIPDDIHSIDTIIPECLVDDKPIEHPAHKAAPVPAALSPPAPKTPKSTSPSFMVAAIIGIILVVLAGAVIISYYPWDTGETTLPAVVTVITVQPTPTLLPAPVPADGVWVRIEYPGTFIGEVGNPELMHPVSGTGVGIYKVLWSDRIVQVSAQKQENSGDTLLVEVYNNGTLIKRGSTRVPMGNVKILIDPITGRPPGIGYGDIP